MEFAESLLRNVTDSITTTSCNSEDTETCRDESGALVLKYAAIASILVAGAAGVAIPLIGKQRKLLRTDGSLFVAAKAFAAGVILATGFVHMLDAGTDALKDPCLPEFPWSRFPFPGFLAMISALVTLLVEFVGTQYYERKHEQARVWSVAAVSELGVPFVEDSKERNSKIFGEEDGGGIHIVGIHAHAAHHRHNHSHGGGGEYGCESLLKTRPHNHGHSHGEDDVESEYRHVVVSQILELGIVSHSVIIGLSLGVSNSPCTIKPLIAALSFHQFFEGFALGGCISQAQFSTMSATIMACFFAITTPAGIGIGVAVSSFYNSYSVGALVVEGVLDSFSAGILVYMALVDLIAADFLSKRMRCNLRLQVVSYCMLFLGAGLMSLLAIWA